MYSVYKASYSSSLTRSPVNIIPWVIRSDMVTPSPWPGQSSWWLVAAVRPVLAGRSHTAGHCRQSALCLNTDNTGPTSTLIKTLPPLPILVLWSPQSGDFKTQVTILWVVKPVPGLEGRHTNRRTNIPSRNLIFWWADSGQSVEEHNITTLRIISNQTQLDDTKLQQLRRNL